ncbi:hypothetical protein OO007_01720 [Cocleimonas sp. KMM 6892]|uniref:hypothetical protein n=1 Tax=unclassified Cocleimonas TaxID=2639732 RepID=UPI002DB83263|nr:MULTISPECIES: hypothetical protein [unclassified Cocleimonas]MEB8430926.1 hypothetical protein [Cocleimonas sp. KMM 6892]MEC4714302.1 hypothetical protein [Cocleimonas sp. KMM 6895]MEC4743633.1 hypothetical protein [Cocleimonas sp. KMM 6896]
MLISIHLPKTAGSSFASSLNEHFGKALLKDYKDLPLHHSSLNRNKHAIIQSSFNYFRDFDNIQCIHGHFLPLKYRFHKVEKDFKYVTWLREPAERLASQYFYMKRHYSHEKAITQPLLKRIVEEKWSLERFCLGPELRNTYSKFLWGFPTKKIDFIGIVENYDNELNFFSETFLKNNALSPYKQNINPTTNNQSYFSDNPKLKSRITQYHAKDYKLYKAAIELAYKQGRLTNTPPYL